MRRAIPRWGDEMHLAPLVLKTRMVPGLPANRSAVRKGGNREIAATLTDLAAPRIPAPITVTGAPSITLHRIEDGGVEVVLERRVSHLDRLNIDSLVAELWLVMQQARAQAEAMSRGPLSAPILRALGHPYGRDKGGARRVPRFGKGKGKKGKSVGHAAGVRGSAPTLAIVNMSKGYAGLFARSWSTALNVTDSLITAVLRNTAPYAFYLAAGTKRMQAHGPFAYVMAGNQRKVDSALQREIALARHREVADAMAAKQLRRQYAVG